MKKKHYSAHKTSKRVNAFICALVLIFTLVFSAFDTTEEYSESAEDKTTVFTDEVGSQTDPGSDVESGEPTPAPTSEPTPAPTSEPTPAPSEEPEEPEVNDEELPKIDSAVLDMVEMTLTLEVSDPEGSNGAEPSGVDSVVVDGKTVDEQDGKYVYKLTGEKTSFEVVVADNAGNERTETINIELPTINSIDSAVLNMENKTLTVNVGKNVKSVAYGKTAIEVNNDNNGSCVFEISEEETSFDVVVTDKAGNRCKVSIAMPVVSTYNTWAYQNAGEAATCDLIVTLNNADEKTTVNDTGKDENAGYYRIRNVENGKVELTIVKGNLTTITKVETTLLKFDMSPEMIQLKNPKQGRIIFKLDTLELNLADYSVYHFKAKEKEDAEEINQDDITADFVMKAEHKGEVFTKVFDLSKETPLIYRYVDVSCFTPYYICLVKDGNMLAYRCDSIYRDNKDPYIVSISLPESKAQFDKDANYYSAAIEMTVEANDREPDSKNERKSGVASVQLGYKAEVSDQKKDENNVIFEKQDDQGENYVIYEIKNLGYHSKTEKGEEWKAELSGDFFKTTVNDAKDLYIVVTDFADNKTAVPISDVSKNDDIESNKIIIGGKGNLEVSITADGYHNENEDNNVYWYGPKDGKNYQWKVTGKAANNGGGISGHTIFVDGNSVELEDGSVSEDGSVVSYTIDNKAENVDNAENFDAEKSEYTVGFSATNDLTGYTAYAADITLKLDETAPTIETFSYNKPEDASSDAKTVEATTYGLFFRADTTIFFNVADKESGVETVTAKLIDKSGENVNDTENAAVELKDGTYEYTVDANFKGDVEFTVTDNVKNSKTYYASDLMIIETQEHHTNEGNHVTIDHPDTDCHRADKDKTDLYNPDVALDITVSDKFCGIKEVKIVLTGGIEKTVTLKSSDKKPFGSDNTSEPETVSADGIFTEVGFTYKIDGKEIDGKEIDGIKVDLSKNITATVTMTDNAGNTSVNDYTFAIDTKDPIVTVAYSNNDVANKKYFKENRIATITVEDDNFEYSEAYLDCDTTGTIKYNKDSVTVTFSEDGEHTLRVSAIDFAGNTAKNINTAKNTEAPWEFIVDKTPPIITVVYNNNDVLNGEYFKAGRIANINVDDKNFANNAEVTIGASIAEGTKPSAKFVWTDTGVGNINFSQDGDYTLKITAVDLAGNPAEEVVSESSAPWKFTVDTTAPTLEIGGVTNNTAYDGAVAPSFTYHDINFNESASSIVISGVKHQRGALPGTSKNDSMGGSFEADNIRVVKEADDIYTITASIVDKAGNTTEKTVTFSVNRFGSTYDFDDSTKALLKDFYTPKSKEVVIYEVNVSKLKDQTVTVSNNGESKTLAEGKDYTIKYTSNGWMQYAYIISADVFDKDGNYDVVVTSVDEAGNKNTNRTVKKDGGVVEATAVNFVVDTTKPTVVIDGVKQGKQYVAATRNILVRYDDNVGTAKVELYLNDKLIATYEGKDLAKLEKNEIPYEAGAQNSWQTLKAVSYDNAGNVSDEATARFLLTSNLFVQFIHNIVAILIFVAVVLAIIFLVWKRRNADKNKAAAV